MAQNQNPWVGLSQPKDLAGKPIQNGGRPPKHDYDGDDFYDQVFYLAFNGAINSEIAVSMNLTPDVFNKMVNGNYQPWNEEENARRSARLSRVLANAREKINLAVRGRYLKAALGGIKVKSKTIRYIKGEEDQTLEVVQETETELAPNMQALTTWMYHHDPEYRKVQRGFEPSDSQTANADNIEQGVNIAAWIEDHVVVKNSKHTTAVPQETKSPAEKRTKSKKKATKKAKVRKTAKS